MFKLVEPYRYVSLPYRSVHYIVLFVLSALKPYQYFELPYQYDFISRIDTITFPYRYDFKRRIDTIKLPYRYDFVRSDDRIDTLEYRIDTIVDSIYRNDAAKLGQTDSKNPTSSLRTLKPKI